MPVEYKAKSRVVCLTLLKTTFESVVRQFPDEIQKEVTLIGKYVKRMRNTQRKYWMHFKWKDRPRRLVCLQRWWSMMEKIKSLEPILIDTSVPGKSIFTPGSLRSMRRNKKDAAYDLHHVVKSMTLQQKHSNSKLHLHMLDEHNREQPSDSGQDSGQGKPHQHSAGEDKKGDREARRDKGVGEGTASRAPLLRLSSSESGSPTPPPRPSGNHASWQAATPTNISSNDLLSHIMAAAEAAATKAAAAVRKLLEEKGAPSP